MYCLLKDSWTTEQSLIGRSDRSGKIIKPLNLRRLLKRQAKNSLQTMPRYERPRNTAITIDTEFCPICGCVIGDEHESSKPCPK